jgi:perosamine synthetase
MGKNSVNLIIKSIKEVIGKGKHQLHEPSFSVREMHYVSKTIKTNFVSSAGTFVTSFEEKFKKYVKSKNAIAVVNGTQALYIALEACGIKRDDEVLVPSLTFVGTVNAIKYLGARPHFIDSKIDTFGIDCSKLEKYLKKITVLKNGKYINKKTKKIIKAIVPVHVYGHPCDIIEVINISKKFNLKVIEDAAEALGSFYKNKHVGTFGDVGCFSFNGNKIITTGGGGMVVLNNNSLAKKIKHLTTTAKLKHKWEYVHDKVGYNFRMPNINAALGLAQLERINIFLSAKRKLFNKYYLKLKKIKSVSLMKEPKYSKSNYWLQTIILDKSKASLKNKLLSNLHKQKIFSRPVWKLISELKPYKNCQKMNLSGSKEIYKRAINIPSSSDLVLKKK